MKCFNPIWVHPWPERDSHTSISQCGGLCYKSFIKRSLIIPYNFAALFCFLFFWVHAELKVCHTLSSRQWLIKTAIKYRPHTLTRTPAEALTAGTNHVPVVPWVSLSFIYILSALKISFIIIIVIKYIITLFYEYCCFKALLFIY